MSISFGIKVNFTGIGRLNLLFKKSLKKNIRVQAKQLLKYSVYGSPLVPEKAPVKDGILRYTASVFVDNELQEVSDFPLKPDARVVYEPAKSDSANGKTDYLTTIVFNAPYADKMHEINYEPGLRSISDGNSNPGNQWLRKHLFGDGPVLFKKVGIGIKTEVFG